MTHINQGETGIRRIYFLVGEIEGLIKKHHPDAECGGTEPEIPAFP